MVLYLSHAQGGFGVTFNDITKDAAVYTTISRWSSPPLVLLRDIHDGLLAKYDCKDSVSPSAQPGARARPAHDSQDGLDGASQEEVAPLFLP